MAANHRAGLVNGGDAQNVDYQEPGPSGGPGAEGQAAAEGDGTTPPTRKPRKTQASVQNYITELTEELLKQRKEKIEIEAKIKEIEQKLKDAKKELENMKKTAKQNRLRRQRATKQKQRAPRQTNRVPPKRKKSNPNQNEEVQLILNAKMVKPN